MIYPKLKFQFSNNTYYDNSWRHKFWYEDYFGNILSKERYRYAKSFNEGCAFVYKEDKSWDIINAVGESQINKFKFSERIKIALQHVSTINGFFIKNYIIDYNIIISVDWTKLKYKFKELKLEVKYSSDENIKQGYLVMHTTSGNMSLIEDYSMSGNGLIAIKHFNKKWIYLEIQSFRFHWMEKNVFGKEFDNAFGYSEGLAKVRTNNLYGFINTSGEYSITPLYDDARSFYNGYAAVAVANCRDDLKNWNTKKRFSDLAWNFIDKKNEPCLSDTKELLSMIDSDLNYYYKNIQESMYAYEKRNLNPEYLNELSRAATTPASYSSILEPSSDHWYSSTRWGQLYPSYLINLLTSELGDELHFHKWYIKNDPNQLSAFWKIRTGIALDAETFFIDFDTTQSEIDYLLKTNSLELKYGEKYSSGKWKSNRKINNGIGRTQLDIDWSSYDDGLDMDQQSIDFWNQF